MAVNDGVIKKIGKSKKLGRYVVLQDVYGNRYTYAHLGSVSKLLPGAEGRRHAVARPQRACARRQRVRPDARRARVGRPPARLVRHRQGQGPRRRRAGQDGPGLARRSSSACSPTPTCRARARPAASSSSSTPRRASSGKFETFKAYFSRPFGLDPSKVRLRPLKKGSHVIGGTDPRPRRPTVAGKAAHLDFAIRPAGRGAPKIDPKPILDGWKLLEATAIYRASGRNVLYGKDNAGAMSIGQILLLPKPLLEQARALRRAHRHLRGRPRRHPLRPDRPARAGDARVPGRVRPAAHRQLPEERPRLLHELGQRLRALAPATRSTSRWSTASRSSATRSRAGSPSRRCAA